MISIAHTRQSTRTTTAIVAIAMWLCGRSIADASTAPPGVEPFGPLTLTQYAHSSWFLRNGFVKGTIRAMAQGPDGYLWLGTDAGLFRFDGVRAVPWMPASGERLSNTIVTALAAASDGTLWIGTFEGLVSWNSGRLARHKALSNEQISSIVQTRDGTIWVGTSGAGSAAGKLCAIRDAGATCSGDDGTFGDIVWSIAEDRAGTLWVTARTGVWRGTAASLSQHTSERTMTRFALTPAAGAAGVTVGYAGHVRDVHAGTASSQPLQILPEGAEIICLLRDRDGGLWIGTDGQGLVRAYGDHTSAFTTANGLSGDQVSAMLQDREGTIWVATSDGLDRFRVPPVRSVVPTDASGTKTTLVSVLGSRDGSLWLGTNDGLQRRRDGRTTIYRRGSTPGLLDDRIESLSEDEDGRVWVTGYSGVAKFERDAFTAVPTPHLGYVFAVSGDTRGGVWVSSWDEGVLHVVDGRVVERVSWASLGGGLGSGLVADAAGGAWIATTEGKLAYFRDGRVRRLLTDRDGLGEAHLLNLQRDSRGVLWASTEGGFSRIADGRIHTITTANGLPCNEAHWMIEDDIGSYWLYLRCGLVRVARSEVDLWVTDPKRRLEVTTLDSADGVRLFAFNRLERPQVAKGKDGKIFFIVPGSLSIVDPADLHTNSVPPPVVIEEVRADGVAFAATAGLRLRPHVRNLSIDYTALSLAAPEKMRFRYKLEGQDAEWREVVNDRRVQYSNLDPGSYRFRVIASNDSGVWNEMGAALAFSIAPAYYQTRWFAVLIAVAVAALLWSAYRLRVAQLARQFNRTLEARVSERTRIARDLHDTMLQSFQGALLRFQAVAKVIQTRPDEASARLERALDQAEAAITEGRNAVHGLRASATTLNDLANGIAAVGRELTSHPTAVNPPVIDVRVDAPSRDLNPLVRDEAYQIASEALRNAVKHADARLVTVTIAYEPRQFRLTVRDDGKGIDLAKLAQQPAGHFGLPGMRERATIVSGRLDVRSAVGAGTEVELRVPAAIAYGKAPRRMSWWSRLFAFVLIAMLVASGAEALDPLKHVTQYVHTSWRTQDGSLPAGMFSIAQTSDGFLWVLSLAGDIYRFDGVRFVPWPVPDGPSGKLFADRGGGLWVAWQEFVRLEGRNIAAHLPLKGLHGFQSISADADGTLWVGLRGQDAPLCRVNDSGVKCFGNKEGIALGDINAIVSDGRGGLWLGGSTALVHWTSGAGASETYPVSASISSLARTPVARRRRTPAGFLHRFAPGDVHVPRDGSQQRRRLERPRGHTGVLRRPRV